MGYQHEIIEEIKALFIKAIDDTGEIPTMQQLRDYLDDNYAMGNLTEEFLINIFS